MNIRTPAELKNALYLAVNGDKSIIQDIATYVAYNYYMHMHTKFGSQEDLANELIYTAFEIEYPEVFEEIETVVNRKFDQMESED